MFDALEVFLMFLERLVSVEAKIRRKSRPLAVQLERAADSVALNLGEGRARKGGDSRRCYEIAAGSASEVTAALRVAVVRRYISAAELAEVDAPLDRVRAMLFRLTH